jgi:hypothetical protein
VFVAGLVLEPLSYERAKELGEEVLGHCFTRHKAIQDGLTTVTVALDREEQCVIVKMAEDVTEHTRIRQVRITHVTITKRDASEDGAATKSKKVGPQQPTLRATFTCLIDPAEKTHRDFLALNFGKSLYFTFQDEQENLFTFAPSDDDADGDDEDLVDKADAPATDPDAGDVLDEQTSKRRRGKKPAKPRLVNKPNGAGADEGVH